MKILKKLGGIGVTVLILNEIRGILVVATLLSGGAQALAQTAVTHPGADTEAARLAGPPA
jgi:hypothetical protein